MVIVPLRELEGVGGEAEVLLYTRCSCDGASLEEYVGGLAFLLKCAVLRFPTIAAFFCWFGGRPSHRPVVA